MVLVFVAVLVLPITYVCAVKEMVLACCAGVSVASLLHNAITHSRN